MDRTCMGTPWQPHRQILEDEGLEIGSDTAMMTRSRCSNLRDSSFLLCLTRLVSQFLESSIYVFQNQWLITLSKKKKKKKKPYCKGFEVPEFCKWGPAHFLFKTQQTLIDSIKWGIPLGVLHCVSKAVWIELQQSYFLIHMLIIHASISSEDKRIFKNQ